ncbi:MAG: hypothetical protein PSX36_00735 [bacterium]|nr:hypothetical protein [bacterium]
MKHTLLTILFLSVFFITCKHRDKKAALKENYDHEIKDRVDILTSLSADDDLLATHLVEIRKELSTLFLLAKDVENLSACANKSNLFFGKMATDYHLHAQDFELIKREMSPSAIELALKKNELYLLNQLVFVNSGAAIRLFSAQSEQGE